MESLAFLQAMRERYGDVFTVRLADDRPLLIVGDPELVRQVFVTPADVLHAGEGNRRTLGWLLGDHSLSLLDEQRHIEHRRLLLPAFHRDRMERHAQAMRATAERHLAAWPLREEVPSLPRLRMLTLEVVMQAVFGEDAQPSLCPLRTALLDLQSRIAENGGAPAAKRLVDRAGSLVSVEVARRRDEHRQAGRTDVLSLMLEARLEDGSQLSNAEIRDELMTLLLAGYETTATALAWVLERLARNPASLAAVEAEAGLGGGPHTEATIQETLRMRPPVPMSARLVKRSFRLGGRSISPGTLVGLSALLVHHRDDVYPEPTAFRPERFLARKPGTYTWIPFGGGVRRCIGAGFAQLEMRVVLAALLSRFALRSVRAEPEEMRNRSTLAPARGAPVAIELRRPPARPVGWSAAGSWSGDGLRREVFFFPSRGIELYGSLIAAAEPSCPFGVVACPSWGTDADRSDPLLRSVALAMARFGGAGFLFHYPGHGDSFGELADLCLADLRDAAADAAAEASRRCPELTWIFAGFMLGASVAGLAQSSGEAKPLLLVQPELRPGAYCRWLAETSMQIAPGPSPKQMMEAGDTPGMAYGYPIPRPVLESANAADEAVAAAMASLGSDGAIVRHRKPEPAGPVPPGFELVEVPGVWRFGSQNHPKLATAAAGWLERRTRSEGAVLALDAGVPRSGAS